MVWEICCWYLGWDWADKHCWFACWLVVCCLLNNTNHLFLSALLNRHKLKNDDDLDYISLSKLRSTHVARHVALASTLHSHFLVSTALITNLTPSADVDSVTFLFLKKEKREKRKIDVSRCFSFFMSECNVLIITKTKQGGDGFVFCVQCALLGNGSFYCD